MTDQTQRLEIATVRAEIGSNITYRFNNDAIGAGGIPTESGDIKNLKLIIKEIEDKASVSTSIYTTVADGLAATEEGGMFLVQSDVEAEIYVVWRKVGGVAVDTGKRALSSQAIQDALQVSTEAAQAAAESAAAAQSAADRAETASEAAFINADVYPDVAAGLAAVADGEQFQVLTDEGLEYRRYSKDSATVATEVGEGFPTPKQVEGKLPIANTRNLFNPESVVVGYSVSTSGGLDPSINHYSSDFISVKGGVPYTHTTTTGYSSRKAFYTQDRVFISITNSLEAFVTPEGASFVRVGVRVRFPAETFMLVEGDVLPNSYEMWQGIMAERLGNKNRPNGYAGLNAEGKIPEQLLNGGGSSWTGKRIIALGDSITYGFIPRNAPGYPGSLDSYGVLVARELNTNYADYGISGSTLGNNGLGTRKPFTQRYQNMVDDADLVIVMGGTNDFRFGVPIGVMTDRTDLSFYGALHVLCEGLIEKYYSAPGTEVGASKQIMFMTPLKILDPVTGGLDHAIDPYVEAVKEVCKYYAIPVLDLHNLSGITPHILKTVQGTEAGYTGMYNPYITDGTHPTQKGHEKIARVIAGFIRSLS